MKKFLLIITVVLMVLSGCEKAPSEIIKEPSSSESSVSEESKPEIVEPEEDFEHNPVSETIGIEDVAYSEKRGYTGIYVVFGKNKADVPFNLDEPGIPPFGWYGSKKITAFVYRKDYDTSLVNVLSTDDCGKTWYEYPFELKTGDIDGITVHFYDAENGFFSVNYSDGTGLLYRVKNRGAVVEEIGEVGNVWNMVFVDENHGFLVVGKDWVGIRKTSDGGKTWTDFEFAPPEFEHKKMECRARPIFRGDHGEVEVTVYFDGEIPWKHYKYFTENFGLTWEMA